MKKKGVRLDVKKGQRIKDMGQTSKIRSSREMAPSNVATKP